MGVGELGMGQLSPDTGGQRACSLDPSKELGLEPLGEGWGVSVGSMHRQDSLDCRTSDGRPGVRPGRGLMGAALDGSVGRL